MDQTNILKKLFHSSLYKLLIIKIYLYMEMVLILEIAKCLLNKLGKPLDLINLVEDRPWNDIRYAVDVSKVRELGWKPKYDFNNGIDITLDWYKSHKSEMERLLKLDSRHPMINYMGWL